MDGWYYMRGEDQVGPVTEATMMHLAGMGEFQPATMVRHSAKTGNRWIVLENVPVLQDLAVCRESPADALVIDSERSSRPFLRHLDDRLESPLVKVSVIVAGFLVFVGLVAFWSSLTDSDILQNDKIVSTTNANPPQTRQRAPNELQERRRRYIDDLIDNDIIHKIDTAGSHLRVHVRPLFYDANFEDKQTFIGVCAAYAYELPQDTPFPSHYRVLVYDSRTGKKIGDLTKRGLQMD